MSNEFEFQVVRRKGWEKRGNRRRPLRTEAEAGFPDQSLDIQVCLRRISAAKEDFETSGYYKSFLITLKESIEQLKNRTVTEILCFGLGHIGECMISRYQLALLLCLKDNFKVEKCLVHDPIFYSDECNILKTLGASLISKNEEGKHLISKEGLTIVYLPHCPKQLTNNFLWKNWGVHLKHCILIGNSFSALVESQSHILLEETVPQILNICAYVKEFSLVNSFKYYDIFNDLSIHIFPEEILNLITENFWSNRGEEPVYDKEDIELISNCLVNKLKIEL